LSFFKNPGSPHSAEQSGIKSRTLIASRCCFHDPFIEVLASLKCACSLKDSADIDARGESRSNILPDCNSGAGKINSN